MVELPDISWLIVATFEIIIILVMCYQWIKHTTPPGFLFWSHLLQLVLCTTILTLSIWSIRPGWKPVVSSVASILCLTLGCCREVRIFFYHSSQNSIFDANQITIMQIICMRQYLLANAFILCPNLALVIALHLKSVLFSWAITL
jgi:hypothetical protein